MWPTKKKTRQRRVDSRKSAPGAIPQLWRRFGRAGGLSALALLAVFYAGVLLMDVWPLDPLPYRGGQYLPAEIRSRVELRLPLPKVLEDEERRLRDATPAVFAFRGDRLSQEVLNPLRKLPERLEAFVQGSKDDDLVRRFGLTDANGVRGFWRALGEVDRARYEQAVERLGERLAEVVIVPRDQAMDQRIRNVDEIVVVRESRRRHVEIADMVSLARSDHVREKVRQLVAGFDPALRPQITTFLTGALERTEGTYGLDEETTAAAIARRVRELRADPPPQAFKNYLVGDVLVPRTDVEGRSGWSLQGLGEADRELLAIEHRRYLRAQQREHPMRWWARSVGRGGVIALVVCLLGLYVLHYRPEVAREPSRGVTLALTLLVLLGLVKLITHGLEWNRMAATLPVLMGAMIVTIAFGRRFALTLAGVLTVLTALQMRADQGTLAVLLVSSIVGVFQLDDIRSRAKLLRVAVVAAAAAFVTNWAWSLATSTPWKFWLVDGLWAAGFAVLAGFLVQGILPLIERVFRVATSLTLLEWCDASKPLLKRLAMEAPGTYNHSLQLGTICEAAADAIGARGLLARVGAYYHDIGKTSKSPYFVENQGGGASRHSNLSPAMSLLIIVGHVKDGLEMAREYGLPEVLHEFIATHHGTTLVQYFYRAATEQRKNGTDRAPDEVEFRYPGPKPQSPEAAILMLADASESSVRAMSEPTPGRIENQVHTMISRRLTDGQLDKCDLTLKQVHHIEESITKSLCSIYHARIAYPAPPGQKPSASERAERSDRKGTSREHIPAPLADDEDEQPDQADPVDTRAEV
jgi:putative nucleotidyltransferase with HDIG domain